MPAEMRIRLLKKIFSTVDFERWDPILLCCTTTLTMW